MHYIKSYCSFVRKTVFFKILENFFLIIYYYHFFENIFLVVVLGIMLGLREFETIVLEPENPGVF